VSVKSTFILFALSVFFGGFSLCFAAEVNYPKLSITEGFGSTAGQEPYGQLISFKIGSTVIPADLSVNNPISLLKYNVVGAISSYSWTSVAKDPMKFIFNVSAANGDRIKDLLKKPLANLNVELNFQIFAYEPRLKSFYVTMKSFNDPHRGIMNKFGYKLAENKGVSYPISGTIPKKDGKPMLLVEASTVVTKPINYAVQVVVYPDKNRQDIVSASSPKILNQKPWGSK
jgi:hypothetical protein